MPEMKLLMCRPISLEGAGIPGRLPDKCSKCGQAVWVSPSSWLIMQDNPEIIILCVPCAVAQMEKDGEFEVQAITPAQAEEIEEYLDSR